MTYRPGDWLTYGHPLRNQPGKADQLTQVDADTVTTALDEITTALRSLDPATTRKGSAPIEEDSYGDAISGRAITASLRTWPLG